MAFHAIEIRHHGPIPDSNLTAEISGGRYRLLDQVGGSRSTDHHHEEKYAKLRMEEHRLQVRYT